MDDFDTFASPSATPGAGDSTDYDRAASAFPDISLDGEGDFLSPPVGGAAPPAAAPSNSGFTFDDFETRDAAPVKVTGDDELEKFENQFPSIDVPAAAPPSAMSPPLQSGPSFGATPTFAPKPQQSFTPILNQSLDEPEPQVIKDWREKQATEIAERDEASKAKRAETIAKAERAIDAFYEDYAHKKERAIRENKESEAEYLATLQDSLSAGTTWSRISALIDLEHSQSKTLARTGAGTTDLTRYKEVLLRLKREGESAVGAGGY